MLFGFFILFVIFSIENFLARAFLKYLCGFFFFCFVIFTLTVNFVVAAVGPARAANIVIVIVVAFATCLPKEFEIFG